MIFLFSVNLFCMVCNPFVSPQTLHVSHLFPIPQHYSNSFILHFFLLWFLFLLLERSSCCCDFSVLFTLCSWHLLCGFNDHDHVGVRSPSLSHCIQVVKGRLMEGESDPFSSPDLFLTHSDPCTSLLMCPVDISNSTCLKQSPFP